MKITVKEVPYVSAKQKFEVMVDNKRYTCYIHILWEKVIAFALAMEIRLTAKT